jgi:hypothetical protein
LSLPKKAATQTNEFLSFGGSNAYQRRESHQNKRTFDPNSSERAKSSVLGLQRTAVESEFLKAEIEDSFD